MTSTTTTTARLRRTWWQFAGYLTKRAIFMELHGYQSIYRLIFRRPKVPTGAAGFSYHQPILAIMIVFIVVSAVEVVVLDWIVNRWTYIRIPLLIISIWGLVWMLGLLFGMLVRPHAVGPDGIHHHVDHAAAVGIRVRYGSEVDIPIAWKDVYSVIRRKQAIQDKQPKVTIDENGVATLQMRIQNETNIEVRLERPVPLKLPHGIETVCTVKLYADDPTRFMDAVRSHMSGVDSNTRGIAATSGDHR
jgi:hypothetical protein